MGYGATLMVILLGVSLSFYFYGEYLIDPMTQNLGLDAEHAANLSAQAGKPLASMTGQGTSSSAISASDSITNTIIGIVAGGGIAGAISLLSGGSFAAIYIVPAAVVGGLISYVAQPLDAINVVLSGAMPSEVKLVFYGFMMTVFLLMVLAFIFGGDRV